MFQFQCHLHCLALYPSFPLQVCSNPLNFYDKLPTLFFPHFFSCIKLIYKYIKYNNFHIYIHYLNKPISSKNKIKNQKKKTTQFLSSLHDKRMKNNKETNNNNTKLILLHPYILKQGSSNRLWILSFVSLFTLIFLLTLIYTRDSFAAPSSNPAAVTRAATGLEGGGSGNGYPLPKHVIGALLHYSANANTSEKMSISDLKPISDVLRRCPQPCNLLVFGLTHETLLWRSLNSHGRTVFIDENRYYAAYMEEKHPEIEAYDVQYTTKQSEYKELISTVKDQVQNECRPVQNLLFSECKLGLNDLPNQFYDVDWDVILVDGPRGHWPTAPGRMSTIFTSSVLARSKKSTAKIGKTHVFVHDYNLDPQRVSSEEFLCKENLVEKNGMIAHFVLERMDDNVFEFCPNKKTSSPS